MAKTHFTNMAAFCLCPQLLLLQFVSSEIGFTYNGFIQTNLSLDGASYVRSDGMLAVTDDTTKLFGHALYPSPLRFKESRPNDSNNKSSVVTFSTNFVFSINPKYPELGGHGLAFLLFSTKEPKGCLPNQYLGLPNDTSNAEFNTRVLAIEFDVVQNVELFDINNNHSGHLIQAWIEYNSHEKLMNVTISPIGVLRPTRPLISFPVDLSSVLDEYMYVGFFASTGLLSAAHNVLGWNLRIGGMAPDLDPSKL
ncbi:hypothetical protein ACSBR1_019236 [Camellia fascicularis]